MLENFLEYNGLLFFYFTFSYLSFEKKTAVNWKAVEMYVMLKDEMIETLS